MILMDDYAKRTNENDPAKYSDASKMHKEGMSIVVVVISP
jgi:hypothetical protein